MMSSTHGFTIDYILKMALSYFQKTVFIFQNLKLKKQKKDSEEK